MRSVATAAPHAAVVRQRVRSKNIGIQSEATTALRLKVRVTQAHAASTERGSENTSCGVAYAFGGGGSGSSDQEGGVSVTLATTRCARCDGPPTSTDESSASDTPHDASAWQQEGRLATAQAVSG
jgi:hypothetical protein